MANYVNHKEMDKLVWGGPRSQLQGSTNRNGKEAMGKPQLQQYSGSTDRSNPAQGTESIYSLATDVDSVSTDDGYELPQPTSRSDRTARAAENARAVFTQSGHLDSKSFHGPETSWMRPKPERANRSRSFSPNIPGRTVETDGQNGIYSLAGACVSDNTDVLPQNKKVTLTRQRVIHTKRENSSSPVSKLREPRHGSREQKAQSSSIDYSAQRSTESTAEYNPEPRLRGSPEPSGQYSLEPRAQGSPESRSRYSPEPKPRRSLEPNSRPVPAQRGQARGRSREQKKSDQEIQEARASTSSEKFEDALEYLPEHWAPARQFSDSVTQAAAGCGVDSSIRSGTGSLGSRDIDSSRQRSETGRQIRLGSGSGRGDSKVRNVEPVAGGNYEQAWDLNQNLEEKLRNLNLMRSRCQTADSGRQKRDQYQDPWDTGDKLQELEQKFERAKKGSEGKGQSTKSSQSCLPSSQPRSPQGSVSNYEDAWDTKIGLSQMLASYGVDKLGGRPSVPQSSRPVSDMKGQGEPVTSATPLQSQRWYHGNISRDEAEKMLRVCKDGSFLVRDSSDRCHYTLSIKCARQTIHIQIDQKQSDADGGMQYILGKNSKAFATIPTMIQHYSQHVVPIKGADHITLLYPVHRPTFRV